MESQALGSHPQQAVVVCKCRGLRGNRLELSCRNMSWADAPQLWAIPQVPDVALQFASTTAELGEVMLT